MNEADLPLDDSTPKPRGFRGLPRWKQVLVIGAGVLVVAGLALLPFQSQGAGSLSTSGGPEGAGLNPAGTGEGAVVIGEQPAMSPALLKLGFSFFAAFAAGLALRTFLRLALIFVGLQILALMGLSYLGWIEVHWDIMSHAFDRFSDNVQKEAGSFQTFITGSLPQAGLATMGLFAGLKR